jgi:hypothetical protein
LISPLASRNRLSLQKIKVESGNRAKENVFNLEIRLIMKLEEDRMMEWKVHEGFLRRFLRGARKNFTA